MDFVFNTIRTFSCVFPPFSVSDAEKTCVLHSGRRLPVTLALDRVEVAEDVGLVERGHGHHHEVPEEEDGAELLVHLPVVGVRDAYQEDHRGEQSQGGVEDPLVNHTHLDNNR